MEDNFRNALIIISAIVIAAIFIHGLWTIRKNKNPYKLKTGTEKVDLVNREFDGKGFDQDGVGQVKVINSALTGEIDNPPGEEEIPHKPAPAPTCEEEPLPCDVEASSPELDATIEPLIEHEPLVLTEPECDTSLKPSASTTLEEPKITAKPVYDEPVINAKPKAQINASKSKERVRKTTAKRNQFELEFGDVDTASTGKEPSFSEPQITTQDVAVEKEPALEPAKAPALETEVIVLSVVMQQGQIMSGASLLPSLLTLGMKYGEMNIFHRHQDNAGNGKVTFSVANMMNPGTFDLDNMENFTTQGVSLFMTLPNAGDAFEVFDQMLASAKQLGQEFNALVLDDKRSIMTKQTEQHYVNRIREYERKSRIAHA